MPFIIPVIAGIAGILSANKQQGIQQKALSEQDQIAQQEMADKQKIFQQLTDFFTPYLKSGSPFLQNIQAAAAGQNAQQTNNAAGTFRNEMTERGTGYGPSGTTAAGLAGIGANSATMGASNYLQNLLNNEQVKFQAASGLNTAGQTAGSPQNQPNVGVNLPAQNTASSVGSLGDILKGLLLGQPSASPTATANTQPNSAQNFFTPGTTQGIPA